ncbi:toll-like receptor 5 [Saccostrea echinata]|uniref:toll-like receptor 5 n=1 Tax=Saccostrea echinata TaxID=191078 RepID=UPI002A80B1BC|nr:toll-like receptor 5 [Saccostrea echinata]
MEHQGSPVGMFVSHNCSSSGFVCIVFRKRLDYRLYRIRQHLKQRNQRRNKNHILLEDKRYDVYLSYAESDYPWVLNHLLPYIDNEEMDENHAFGGNFKTYFSDRDAHQGLTEIGNMCQNIEMSKNCLIILSRNYTQKPLHSVELDHMLLCKEDSIIQKIILVMIEELKFEQIPVALHRKIKKEEVLRWEHGQTKERQFQSDLVWALRRN